MHSFETSITPKTCYELEAYILTVSQHARRTPKTIPCGDEGLHLELGQLRAHVAELVRQVLDRDQTGVVLVECLEEPATVCFPTSDWSKFRRG